MDLTVATDFCDSSAVSATLSAMKPKGDLENSDLSGSRMDAAQLLTKDLLEQLLYSELASQGFLRSSGSRNTATASDSLTHCETSTETSASVNDTEIFVSEVAGDPIKRIAEKLRQVASPNTLSIATALALLAANTGTTKLHHLRFTPSPAVSEVRSRLQIDPAHIERGRGKSVTSPQQQISTSSDGKTELNQSLNHRTDATENLQCLGNIFNGSYSVADRICTSGRMEKQKCTPFKHSHSACCTTDEDKSSATSASADSCDRGVSGTEDDNEASNCDDILRLTTPRSNDTPTAVNTFKII